MMSCQRLDIDINKEFTTFKINENIKIYENYVFDIVFKNFLMISFLFNLILLFVFNL